MFERLPREIQMIILNECNFKTLLRLRQVCWLCSNLAEVQLHAKTELDIVAEYFEVYDGFSYELFNGHVNIVPEKVIYFLEEYVPALRRLSFRNAPLVLQLSALIQIAKAVPLLESLDLSQVDNKPQFGKDAAAALPYFHNLKYLKLDGYCIRRATGKGCSYRLEIPPLKKLNLLESLEIMEGSEYYHTDTIVGILSAMRRSNTVLHQLQNVSFGVQQCHSLFPDLLVWFLLNHKKLRSVRLYNILFETSQQLRKFYNALIMLPSLLELNLDRCHQVGHADIDAQLHFIRSFKMKGVRLNGMIQSLHHDPDRVH